MRPLLPALSALAAALALFACDEADLPRDSLTIDNTAALTLVVGDTSQPVAATKVTIDPRTGRETKESDYRYFTLVSDSPAVAAIYAGRRIVAVAPGQTTVRADDDRSALVSENQLTVTVTAP